MRNNEAHQDPRTDNESINDAIVDPFAELVSLMNGGLNTIDKTAF